ncbi:signal peptidase II [Rubripirellula sp.]|nr:signal peptidase II [Rubripirellula sp.]MDB4338547.1 signal peptidase II [Rubripirellula sp.]
MDSSFDHTDETAPSPKSPIATETEPARDSPPESKQLIPGILFALLASLGLAADLTSKQLIFQWRGLPGQSDPWWLIDGVLGIQTAVNPGAVFGMGAGKGMLFAVFSIFAIAGIVLWMFRFGGCQSKWLTWTLGLITGGILGNLYDRLGFWWDDHLPLEWKSGVRDWVLFRVEGLPFFDPWPNFNIADALLVVGACMLLYQSLVLENNQKESERMISD